MNTVKLLFLAVGAWLVVYVLIRAVVVTLL